MSQYVVVTPEGKQFGPTDFQTLSRWALEGRVAPGMMVEDLLSGQKMVASAVPGLAFGSDQRAESLLRPRGVTAGKLAMIFGLIGLAAWCLPIIGLAVGTAAIVFGLRARNSEESTQAIIGIVLGVFCILMNVGTAIAVAMLIQSLSPG